MNAVAIVGTPGMPPPEMSDTCKIVVLGEDTLTHDKAMGICSRLTAQFSQELCFSVHYWKFNELPQPASNRRAAKAVAEADILVIATHGDDLEPGISEWLERCATQRRERDGALGVLLVEPISPSSSIGVLLSRLECVAARLHLDFLPLLPVQRTMEDLNERANTVTSLLKEMLDPPPSSHWGLNE
jgi:hypothetical protein